MNRRNFLQILAASGAFAATFDVEKLLWTPKPMIVVPEMPKIYAPGNFWLENWGEAVLMVTPSGFKKFYTEYEVSQAMKDVHENYQKLEAKYSNKL